MNPNKKSARVMHKKNLTVMQSFDFTRGINSNKTLDYDKMDLTNKSRSPNKQSTIIRQNS